MDENLENQADTTQVVETAPEQGTVSDDRVDTTPVVETEPVVDAVEDKDAQKAQMRENQIKNTETQARELEKATGMKLEDLLATLNSAETPVEVAPEVQTDDVDMDRFAELTDMAVKAKYGDKFARLDRMDEYFAKLEAKEAVSALPADYKDYEADMMDFISKNTDIMKTNEGVMTAYYAAKGKNIDKITKSVVASETSKLNNTEEVKKVAFVENAKNSGKEETAASLKDIVNLSQAEYANLPKEVREKLLKTLSQ